MRKILLYTLMTLAAAGMASCEDFLTRDTYDQIGSDEFWKSETDLELYANGFIQKMIPGDGTITRGDIYADYCAVDIPTDLLRPDGNVSPDNQTGWAESNWTNLRRVNYMLDNMHKCKGRVSDEIYNHYEGVARFWRAWFYYDKVQTFGAVPWYDFTIAASDKEAMMKPRDSREYVMDKVLEDLTFASTYCLSDAKFTKGSALINKWVALAFKSRVCLYEGTFRKYHSREPSSDKPWQAEYNADNKFLREAAAAAKEIMDKGPYSLVTGDVKTAYRSLFTSAGLLTQEVIFGREYSKELSAFHETSWYYYSPTYGAKIAMTKKFMNTYLTTRGTPFTDIDGYQTIDFIREFDGRDARMAQTVISPTYKMKISGRERLYSPNWKGDPYGLPSDQVVDRRRCRQRAVEGRELEFAADPPLCRGAAELRRGEGRAGRNGRRGMGSDHRATAQPCRRDPGRPGQGRPLHGGLFPQYRDRQVDTRSAP